jgi:hypothetical protein
MANGRMFIYIAQKILPTSTNRIQNEEGIFQLYGRNSPGFVVPMVKIAAKLE